MSADSSFKPSRRAVLGGAAAMLGTAVAAGDPVALVHAARADEAEAAVAAVRAAIQIGAEAVTPPLIHARVNP